LENVADGALDFTGVALYEPGPNYALVVLAVTVFLLNENAL
jgi:hypothetical protein